MEYNQLKASIAAVIKTNNRKEITGQLLQNVLFEMTNVIGENLQLAGFATPLTDPHEPDQNVFYITDQGGVYPQFGNLTVDDGLTFLMWKNGEWTSHTVGVVTQEWVDSHYVSIDFFRSLFRAYDSAGLEILPNNNPEEALPTVVDNIKAMVGFWTEQYLSALGQGSGGGGGGGGGGSTTLDGLDDVELTSPLTSGQVLTYDGSKWVNGRGGIDITSVWNALGAATGEQINISHLTTALSGYATQEWVGQNYISIAYFDRLFRAYNGDTLVSHNDVTSTIDNIKAMFGFWTDFYLSALGHNSQVSDGITLDMLSDVTLTTPIADKQVLTFDAVSGKWVNSNAQAGATALANLTDVTLTTPVANQVLLYDGTTSKWINSAIKTINGQPIYGSGDISVGGGATGNYLPLAGGTMTGTIFFNKYGRIIDSNDFYIGLNSNSDYYLYTSKAIDFNIYTNSIERITVKANGNVGIQNTSPNYALDVNGISKSIYMMFRSTSGGDAGYIGRGESAGNNIVISAYAGNRLSLGSNNYSKDIVIATTHNVGIGTENPSYLFHVNGVAKCRYTIFDAIDNSDAGYIGRGTSSSNDIVLCAYASNRVRLGANNSTTDLTITTDNYVGIGTITPSYKLTVSGDIYATGAITALSDARKKDITGEAEVSVEQIAHAPAVQFLWKDKERRKDGQQVGTLAQYWQTVLPEVVSDKGGELSMQYGVAALVSSIIIARKVANHEVRIDKMEKWMKKWAEENDE